MKGGPGMACLPGVQKLDMFSLRVFPQPVEPARKDKSKGA